MSIDKLNELRLRNGITITKTLYIELLRILEQFSFQSMKEHSIEAIMTAVKDDGFVKTAKREE